jgi:hypothetical protein
MRIIDDLVVQALAGLAEEDPILFVSNDGTPHTLSASVSAWQWVFLMCEDEVCWQGRFSE